MSHVQVRGIFGGGNKNEDSDTQTSSSSHVSANASRTEKKEVTKAYAVSDVRARPLAKTAWWMSDVTSSLQSSGHLLRVHVSAMME